ncbi:MAG: CaiB/BaiF CoA-transferase family protein [Bacteroidota bacterium]
MHTAYFKDLKIIELAGILAGPHVGMFFAEFGAKVIKYENRKTDGDHTRKWKLPTETRKSTISAYYSSINFQKEVRLIDLNDPTNLQALFDEIKNADILISNFRDRSAIRKQLDYQHLSLINPQLIYAQLVGFLDQPDRPAFDVVLQAEAGFLSMSGAPGGDPIKMPVALIDVLAAHHLKEAILIALIDRFKTNQGAHIKVSLFQAAVSSLINQATNYLMAKHIPQPLGMAHPNIAPYGDYFQTADHRQIVLAVGSDAQFKGLCQVLDLPNLPLDERFKTNQDRLSHRTALNTLLAEAFLKKEATILMDALLQQNVPAGLIRNVKEVFELDEAQRLIREEIIENTATQRVSSIAFKVETITSKKSDL